SLERSDKSLSTPGPAGRLRFSRLDFRPSEKLGLSRRRVLQRRDEFFAAAAYDLASPPPRYKFRPIYSQRCKMAGFKTLDDIGDVKGKRVLVRVDLNVPVADGKITDTTRIERVIPTIDELSKKGAKVILLAHFG